MIGRLRDLGMSIDAALETQPATTEEDALGRPRIARAMIAAGYATSVEDAFNRHLSRGRPAYVPRDGPERHRLDRGHPRRRRPRVARALRGGAAALRFLRELIDAGLNGLEVYYRAYELPTVQPSRVATELRLVMTGGTDYHGDRETYAEAHAQLWFPAEAEARFRDELRAAV